MHFVGTPIDVQACFKVDGTIIPTAFTWEGRIYPITDVGRRWDEEGQPHILVMSGHRVFELAFDPTKLCWRLERAMEKPAQA
jgi:hypothetical protein